MHSVESSLKTMNPLNTTTMAFLVMAFAVALIVMPVSAQDAAEIADTESAQWEWNPDDPRIGLSAGLHDAGEAAWNMQLLANLPKPEGFTSEEETGGSVSNSDLAFRGDMAFVGNYRGFNIYDISDPANPTLRVSIICPGGQGDISVFGDLLFMSVQETRGRLDCGTQGVPEVVSEERFRGLRIFDISDVDTPRQVAAVQTCRGSHTHTILSPPGDDENLYVYISGTNPVRPGEELEGCSGGEPDEDPNTSYFRIEVIQVPLAAPETARVVNEPRVFADAETGDIAGLWKGGSHGDGTQVTDVTDQCHDITVYPALGLAAGACSGNGILFDISDPVNPVRIDVVSDPNFAYWHSATFNNDGTKVIFTDEWGGGSAPHCMGTDLPTWGADAIFDLVDGKLKLAGYYKLPAPQTEMENCVAHNGSLIPVPGRDIKVQAWYQGGLSMFDFSDPENPLEIAFFDRGPISDEIFVDDGGYWSTYWFNGNIYGSEMARGFDVFELFPSEHLSQNEIDAAKLIHTVNGNAQHQGKIKWPAEFVVARAYVDQLKRSGAFDADEAYDVMQVLNYAEHQRTSPERRQAVTQMEGLAAELNSSALASLAEGSAKGQDRTRVLLARTVRELAFSMR